MGFYDIYFFGRLVVWICVWVECVLLLIVGFFCFDVGKFVRCGGCFVMC